MLHEEYPALPQAEPLVKDSFAQTAIPLTNKVSLFATLETISQPVVSVYPQTMEQLGQNTGYLLYRTSIEKDAAEEKLRVIDGRDRLQLFVNQVHQATQYQTEIGEDIYVTLPQRNNQIDVLMENMGRVTGTNYLQILRKRDSNGCHGRFTFYDTMATILFTYDKL